MKAAGERGGEGGSNKKKPLFSVRFAQRDTVLDD